VCVFFMCDMCVWNMEYVCCVSALVLSFYGCVYICVCGVIVGCVFVCLVCVCV